MIASRRWSDALDPIRPTVGYATPEDVPLHFELAGAGTRILAALIDQLIIGTILFGLYAVAVFLALLGEFITESQITEFAEEIQTGQWSAAVMGVALLASFVVNFGYYVVLEMTTNGQTVGKKAMGLRVIRDGGYGLTLAGSLLRNLGRMVDMLPGTYLVGMVLMVWHRQEKRLGDLLAGTVVVRERRRSAAGLPFGDQRYSTLPERRFRLDRAALQDLGEEHEQVLQQFFSRPRLPREHEGRIVERLCQGFAARLPAPVAFESERDRLLFLKELYLALRERRELG